MLKKSLNLFKSNATKIVRKDFYFLQKIINAPSKEKTEIKKDIRCLWEKYDLGVALQALYRQQVNCGFVLSDPLDFSNPENEKSFYDPITKINFLAQWNPERALRKDHRLLIRRGIIEDNIDEEKLINKDEKGRACYLCINNINLQNPKEITLPLILAGEPFFAGANFASISNHHFTIFHEQHHPQQYRKEIFPIMEDFLDQTGGSFRIIYNGLAGASIEAHEHFQTTSISFPVEKISFNEKNIVYNEKDVRILKPCYYLPLWIVEGNNRDKLNHMLNNFIHQWHSQQSDYHTENIFGIKRGSLFRFFIFLRDRSKFNVREKEGALATFEVAGLFVFSESLKKKTGGKIEKDFFYLLTLDIIKNILKKIAPKDNLNPNSLSK